MERLARRAARQAKQRRRLRARRRRQLLLLSLSLAILCCLLLLRRPAERQEASSSGGSAAVSLPEVIPMEPPAESQPLFTLSLTEETVLLGEDFPSAYALLADAESGAILADKGSDQLLSPASMTKLLTLLVAAETITDWDQSFTMTREISDYCYTNDCSVVGYEVGEVVPARELLYGCILPSGADAALGLAILSAGSHEAFVEKMNEKCSELGLSDEAHFTNCVGLYDPEHHCTLRDIALILQRAMEDPICQEILPAKIYHSAATGFHPEGQDLSNWFLRRIEDKDCGTVTVLAAKTGFVTESGSCAASLGESANGRYLCVTAGAHSAWQAIYDHAALYQSYAK